MYFIALFLLFTATAFSLRKFYIFLESTLLIINKLQLNFTASDVKKCKIDDNLCILSSANYVLKNYFSGHPDLLFESIDPLKIDSMTVQQNSPAVNIFTKLTNFEIVGFSGAHIYQLDGFENDVIDLKFKTDSATLLGPYKINGNILILPVNGAGKMKLHFSE